MHLKGGVAAPDRPEQRRLVKSPVGRKPTRENLVEHSGGDDVLRNIDTLPQQLQKWQEHCLAARLQRQARQELFHGTVVEPHPEQYFASVTQATRDREHLMHAAGWAATLRQRELRDGGTSSTKIPAQGRRQQAKHVQSTTGTESSTWRTLRGLSSSDTEAVRTVNLADILREMQLRSGSRAFCSAEDFESILLDFGVDFRHPLVSSITRVCPISDDGIISFAPLYSVVDELHCSSAQRSSRAEDSSAAATTLEAPSSFQRRAAASGGEDDGRGDGEEKTAEVTSGKAGARSTTTAQQAMQLESSSKPHRSSTATTSGSEGVFSAGSSADLFPVHNFENTPLPQSSRNPEHQSSQSRVDVSVHLSPRGRGAGDSNRCTASVSLLVEL